MITRKATMRDIPAMLELINRYAREGIMLPRTEFEMAENIRDFTVAEREGRVLACGALHFYTPTMGEVRSIAVDPENKGTGLGRRLVAALEEEARECRLDTLFAFTYVPSFFRKLGFTEVDRSELPLKAWKDCMRCPKFHCCDELPMIKHLTPSGHHPKKLADLADPDLQTIQLPSVKPQD